MRCAAIITKENVKCSFNYDTYDIAYSAQEEFIVGYLEPPPVNPKNLTSWRDVTRPLAEWGFFTYGPTPKWYDEEKARKQVEKGCQKILNESFLINVTLETVKNANLLGVINCNIKLLKNSKIDTVYESIIKKCTDSNLNELRQSSVAILHNSTINYALGATIAFCNGSFIKNALDDTLISRLALRSVVFGRPYQFTHVEGSSFLIYTDVKNAPIVKTLGDLKIVQSKI